MYPIEELIQNRMKELGLTRSEVARRVGYKNLSKGVRKLQEYMVDGVPSGLYDNDFWQAIEVDRNLYQDTLQRTWDLMEQEEQEHARRLEELMQKNYTPHLYVVTERWRPSNLTICAFLGLHRYKKEPLPQNFNSLTEKGRGEAIQQAIRSSLSHYHGTIPLYGNIRGFLLHTVFGIHYKNCPALDLEGRPVDDPSLYDERYIDDGTGKPVITYMKIRNRLAVADLV